MANKCTPKPASFDSFLITNNSQWESKICTYEKECWSCLSCLPRSLFLKQICTFCSPGIDTSSGWTRTLPACSARSVWKSCRDVGGHVPGGGCGCPPTLGLTTSHGRGEGLNPSRGPPLPTQTSSTQAHLPMAAGHIKLLPLGNNSVRNHFSCGVHCLAKSQIPKQGTVLCDGAGESSRVGLLSPLWQPHVTSPGAQSPYLLPSLGSVSRPPAVSLSVPQPRNSTEISWIP